MRSARGSSGAGYSSSIAHGAVISAKYNGRLQLDTMSVYATPLFHTGDDRYAWLNRIQGVAKGTFTGADTVI